MPACPNCAADAADGQNFCFECGAALGTACPKCNTPFPPGARFCGGCGQRLGEEEAPPTTAPAAPERRLVSVLFADLVGYSTMSEHRDPEDVREFLSNYFAVARDVVERYGGSVEKFIGDAVMATWGSPIAREDDAELAVRAALDLTIEMDRLGNESDTDVSVRVGVATGEVAVVLGAPASEGMAGDLVNSAARLEGIAEPGTVLVNGGTHRAAGRAIAFRDMGELAVKGKSETIHAYRPIRVAAKLGGAAPSTLAEPAFVGRRSELQLLRELTKRSRQESEAHLVSVIGVAGIGKSRLIDELEKHLDGLTATTYWHRGRSPSYGDGVTFWALSEMVKNRAGITEADDDQTQRRRLAESVDEFVDETDRDWVTTALAVLLGVDEPGAMDAGEAEAGWRRFFESIAADAPTVMVFEDIHWADHGLLDFIESILGWSRRHPLTILTLARPELLERRPNWGAGMPGFTSIHLDRLEDSDVDEMLESMAPGLPADVKASVADRAEGIPLYIVETVRILADSGAIEVTDTGTEVTGPITFSVPESLHALIAARLDALGVDDRKLVQTAAVLGQSFDQKALAEITGIPPGDLGPRLDRLVLRQILRVDDDPRSNERGFHQFVQGVIREVALGTISKTERRQLHLRIADHLETSGEIEVLPVIVHHLTEAMALGDPESLRARALGLLSRAATRSASLGSHEQEISFLEHAVALSEEPAETAGFVQRLANAATLAGRADVAIDMWRDAHARYADLDDVDSQTMAAVRLAHALLMAGQMTEASDLLATAALRAEGAEVSRGTAAWLLAERARAAGFTGDGAEAIRLAEEAGVVGDPLGGAEVVVEAMVTRAWGLHYEGRFYESVATNRGALELAASHEVRAEYRARNNLVAYLWWSDPAEAYEIAKGGMALGLRNGDAEAYAGMLAKAAGQGMEIGEWDEVADMYASLPTLPYTRFTSNELAATEAVFRSARGEMERAAEVRRELDRGKLSESTSQRFVAMLTSAQADAYVGDLDTAVTTLGDLLIGVSNPVALREATGPATIIFVLARHRPGIEWSITTFEEFHMVDDRTARWKEASRAVLAAMDGDGEAGRRVIDCAARARGAGLVLDAAHLYSEAALLLPRGSAEQTDAETSARELWNAFGTVSLERLLDRRLAE